jgi:hypothetical protein
VRIQQELPVEPGQDFVVDGFLPRDAPGVASLFLSIYGNSYPMETYYDPEWIIQGNAGGSICTAVARTARGDIVAQGAIFRSSPPNPRLFELGQFLVLKSYRRTLAAYEINRYLAEQVAPRTPLCGYYSEAVCNHTVTQKATQLTGACEVAIEMDLMPFDAYRREGATGRVSCVMAYTAIDDGMPGDRTQTAYLPAIYRRELEYLHADLPARRQLVFDSPQPGDLSSEIARQSFPQAGVERFQVSRTGADFAGAAERLIDRSDAAEVLQWFINTGDPGAPAAAEVLRTLGCFLGGIVPRWFDSDALLMQRTRNRPGFESARLLTDKAKWLLHHIRQDWERTHN